MADSSFGFDEPEESPGFLLWQVSVTWQRQIKAALDQHGIAHAQFVILAVLLWCEESGVSPIQSFLVEKTKLDKMTVSAALKKLASLKLLKRSENANDSRAKTVLLTEKGKQLTKKLVKNVEAVDAAFFKVINQSDQRRLLCMLNDLVRSA